MKKIISVLLMVLILALSVFCVSADTEALYFGKLTATMPEISVEVKGSGYDIADVSATLGTEYLDVNDLQVYDSYVHSTRVYMLVDLSTSMYDYFDIVKESIINYTYTMGADDDLVLITFGEKSADVVLKGTETLDEVYEVVNALECNESGTVFYEALSKAYDIANSSISDYDREYVLAFSDGIDEQTGNVTANEIEDNYKTHSLPLYAACFDNGMYSSTDKFGEIARSSGGDLTMIYSYEDFDNLLYTINDVTLISLSAETNVADGSTKLLSVKIGDRYIEHQIPVLRSLTDTSAPLVTDYDFDSQNLTLTLTFSEKVNSRASSASAYRVTDSEGKEIEVVSASYDSTTLKATLKLGKMKDGTYSVSFSSITDLSLEANKVSDTVTFTAEGIVVEEVPSNEGMPLWLILMIVCIFIAVAAAVVLIIVLSTRRRAEDTLIPNNPPQNPELNVNQYNYAQNSMNVKHHVVIKSSKKVRLHIRTGNISEQSVETEIQSSLIIGRSNTCDIFIDDTKLSRQHFAIEFDTDRFYIMDLQSRNGTMLNGYKVVGRQILNSGDRIVAGLSDIQFTVVG